MERRKYLLATGSVVLLGGTLSKRRDLETDTNRETTAEPPLKKPKQDDEPEETREETNNRYYASNIEELLDGLSSASAGDFVFVPADVEIDLRGRWSIEVPDKVTLASGGRLNGVDGALLHSPEGDEAPERGLRKIELGTEARLTGFQIRGHHHEYINPDEKFDGDFYARRGSGIWAGENAVVDNNDISGWVYAGVWAEDNAYVHHNYIHHNTWEGLGYGVVVPEGDNMPVIEDNEFNYNRHAIAAGGGPKVGYIARHNVVGPDWVGAQFDMHGDEGMVGIAGDEIRIQHNEFRGTHTVEAKTRNPNALVPAIHIRGTPETGVWVENNRFFHKSRQDAYQQTDGPHRVHFNDNSYDISNTESQSVSDDVADRFEYY